METILKDLLFNRKGLNIILNLTKGEINLTEIARLSTTTFSHTLKTVRKLEGLGILSSTRRGRTRYVSLTHNGIALRKELQGVATLVEDIDNQIKR
jgi:predicted transcriptional regulator